MVVQYYFMSQSDGDSTAKLMGIQYWFMSQIDDVSMLILHYLFQCLIPAACAGYKLILDISIYWYNKQMKIDTRLDRWNMSVDIYTLF